MPIINDNLLRYYIPIEFFFNNPNILPAIRDRVNTLPRFHCNHILSLCHTISISITSSCEGILGQSILPTDLSLSPSSRSLTDASRLRDIMTCRFAHTKSHLSACIKQVCRGRIGLPANCSILSAYTSHFLHHGKITRARDWTLSILRVSSIATRLPDYSYERQRTTSGVAGSCGLIMLQKADRCTENRNR